MWIREDNDGTVLACRIHPNARKDSIDPPREDQLIIHLSAPPIEGKANKALVKYLSGLLGVSKTRISIRMGEKGRSKVLFIRGIDPAEVKQRLCLTEFP